MLRSPSKSGLLRVNEGIHAERTASELQDRVTELIEQQTAISEALRAIASPPHVLQPVFRRHPRKPNVSVEQTWAACVSSKKAALV
jgi:hypothetical protein